MKIYVLSLLNDEKRRHELCLNFPKSYSKFQFVWGGKDSNLEDINFVKNMGVNEVNCALGHVEILNKITLAEKGFSLVLEDDMQGSDQDILKIEQLYSKLPENSLLIAGCLPQLKSLNHLYGIKYCEKYNCYKIPKFYYKFLVGACAYVVDQDVAKFLLIKQNKKITRADDWGRLLENHENVFLSYILKHPQNLSQSNIEADRVFFNTKSIFYRVYSKGFFYSFYYFLSKYIGIFLSFIKKYEKIF